MILLGLDPGLRFTGWGVIDAMDNRLRWLADGVIGSDGTLSLAERLAQLHRGVTAVIAAYRPGEVAVEETFMNRNPASALKLGQARGAVLAAASLAGLPVAEYSAKMVKKSVVGTGQAGKEQVGMMVRRLLPGCLAATADAADALAVAISHAHLRVHAARVQAALQGAR